MFALLLGSKSVQEYYSTGRGTWVVKRGRGNGINEWINGKDYEQRSSISMSLCICIIMGTCFTIDYCVIKQKYFY